MNLSNAISERKSFVDISCVEILFSLDKAETNDVI